MKSDQASATKVAVLISVYGKDHPVWFQEAISSIVNQNFSGEIKIYLGVDGKLSPALESVITNYQDRIYRVVRSENNLGLTKMLNKLLDHLEDEEYIFRADSDDINHLERFQKQFDYMESHKDVDVVGSAIEEIDENGTVIQTKVSYPLTHEACLRFFKMRDPLAHPAVLFRKSYFTKAGHYNPDYRTNQDTYMWLTGFLSGCKFANLDDVLLSFRRSSEFYGRRGGVDRALQLLKLRLDISKKMKYSVDAYVYAVLFSVFTLMPSGVKRHLYQKLR